MTNGHRSTGCTRTYRCTSINLSVLHSNLNCLLYTFNGTKLYFVLIHYVTSGSQKVFQFSTLKNGFLLHILADVRIGGNRRFNTKKSDYGAVRMKLV